MSNRKCSIDVIRWCFFFKPRSLIFPRRRRLAFFSISIGESSFFPRWANVFVAEKMKTCWCRSNHNFGWGRTKKPSRRTLWIFMATPNKKASSTVKNIIGQRLWKKLSNVGWKISVGALQRPMSSIELWFQYLNNICMISIRKCSIRVIRWCFFFKPRSLIFPRRR